MAAPASGQIVDEFESSFQACLAALTNPDYFNTRDSEEIKTEESSKYHNRLRCDADFLRGDEVVADKEVPNGVEQTIQHFLDVAKQMECFFLQKRLLLSVQKPEHIILENISELKNELVRKEQLLNKYNEKIQTWQNLLGDVPGTPRPPPAPVPPQPPPNMPPMQGPPPQMPPQVAQQGAPPPHPHHMMQPHIGPPMTSSPAPMQGGMVMQAPQMHPQQHMAAAQQPGGLQGPLAYLERTMSNIGMPDPGR